MRAFSDTDFNEEERCSKCLQLHWAMRSVVQRKQRIDERAQQLARARAKILALDVRKEAKAAQDDMTDDDNDSNNGDDVTLPTNGTEEEEKSDDSLDEADFELDVEDQIMNAYTYDSTGREPRPDKENARVLVLAGLLMIIQRLECVDFRFKGFCDLSGSGGSAALVASLLYTWSRITSLEPASFHAEKAIATKKMLHAVHAKSEIAHPEVSLACVNGASDVAYVNTEEKDSNCSGVDIDAKREGNLYEVSCKEGSQEKKDSTNLYEISENNVTNLNLGLQQKSQSKLKLKPAIFRSPTKRKVRVAELVHTPPGRWEIEKTSYVNADWLDYDIVFFDATRLGEIDEAVAIQYLAGRARALQCGSYIILLTHSPAELLLPAFAYKLLHKRCMSHTGVGGTFTGWLYRTLLSSNDYRIGGGLL